MAKTTPEQRMADRAKELGMTGVALSKAMGTTQQQVSLWTNGKQEMGLDSLKAAAQALGVRVSYLLGETEKPDQPIDVADPAKAAAGFAEILRVMNLVGFDEVVRRVKAESAPASRMTITDSGDGATDAGPVKRGPRKRA